MGQQPSGQTTEGLILSQWIEAVEDSENSLFANVNPFRRRLLLNKNSRELIEEYELQFLNHEDFNCYSNEVELRREDRERKLQILSREEQDSIKLSPYIYKVRYFTNTSVEELCSTIYNGLLYVDKVDLRLKEINDIPLGDQLYLYHATLAGFKILYEKVGFFDITEEMIFFTQDGRAKVWMNPNLSKHHPHYQPEVSHFNSNEVQGSQSEMLKTLINLIEENTDTHSMGNLLHFREYLQEKGLFERLSFYRAIDEYHRYCEQFNLTPGKYMKSIHELYHEEDSHLYHSQTQKSQVHRVHVHKDYDSLRNSRHPRQNPIEQSFRRQPPLQASRVSRNSFNSDIKPRELTGQDSRRQLIPHAPPRRSTILQNVVNDSRAGIQLSYLPVNSQIGSQTASRKIITFSPIEEQPTQSAIQKYKSLQKAVPIPSQNRPITFSYQANQNSPQIQRERKESIIDKITGPSVLRTINSIGSERTSQGYPSQKQVQKKINYYSTSEAFLLDSQIAEDMQKYLGVNPNLL